MPKISLVPYSVTIKQKFSQNDYLNLDDIDGNNFYTSLNGYLTNLRKELQNDTEDKKTLTIAKITNDTENNRISGLFEIGQYGYQEIIRNLDNYETPVFIKDPDQITCIPFYHLFYIPEGKVRGLLMLQQFGNIGVKTLISDYLIKCFKDDPKYDSDRFVLEIKPSIQKELMIKYLENNGDIKKITLIGFTPLTGIEDRYYYGNKDKIKRCEISFLPSKNALLNFFKNPYISGLKGQKNINDIMIVNGFEVNDIKAEFSINGRPKTVRLTKADELTMSHEITENENLVFKNGHPTYESIDLLAIDFLNELVNLI
jgi:hypothetical protein